MNCPDCNIPLRERGDGHFPDCEDCGFELLDAATIQLRAEVEREFKQAQRECYPDPVPSYGEWLKRTQ